MNAMKKLSGLFFLSVGFAVYGQSGNSFNGSYSGDKVSRIAFPIGGMGAGMFCLEGTGALSHVSLRHRPEMFNEPQIFAAIAIKGSRHLAKVLEGPVPG